MGCNPQWSRVLSKPQPKRIWPKSASENVFKNLWININLDSKLWSEEWLIIFNNAYKTGKNNIITITTLERKFKRDLLNKIINSTRVQEIMAAREKVRNIIAINKHIINFWYLNRLILFRTKNISITQKPYKITIPKRKLCL